MENITMEGRTLQARLFGKLEVISGGAALDEENIRSEMVTKLLTYFICHRNRTITIQEIGDALWYDDRSDNPSGALKNLMYRLRTVMKKEWGAQDYILTGRGSYYWNPDVTIIVDTDEFEEFCKKANQTSDQEEKIQFLIQAATLYEGVFLPKFSDEYWIANLSTYFHSMYLSVVKELSDLLEKNCRYDEMVAVCSHAIKMDALEEDLHCFLIKGLIGQNKQNLAIEHYQKAAELLYDNLGVRPSDEFRLVYEELLKQKHDQELDLNAIQQELRQDDDGKGAFLCEYGVFKKSYHLEIRRVNRLGLSIYISLVTLHPAVSMEEDSTAFLQIVNRGMELLQDILLRSLRTGDVISRYSVAQYIIMLPTCQFETASLVMERIRRQFYKAGKKLNAKMHYSVEEIDLSLDN